MESNSRKETKPIELVERTGPEIFRFEAPGDYVRGRLISMENTHINGKSALKYVLHDLEEDRFYSFLGTVDLNTKIRPTDVGKVLEVRYERQDSPSDNGKNPLKHFKVFVEKG